MLLSTARTSALEGGIDLPRGAARTIGICGLMTVEPLLSMEGIAVFTRMYSM
jgi:hypothetical protein